VLSSVWFDIGIGIVIAFNAVSIGIEQTLELNGHSTLVTSVFESIFLVIYILELSLRFFVDGRKAVRGSWVKFDLFLVIVGVLGSWVLEIALTKSQSRALGPLMVLRTMRLLRLAKTMRLFTRVQECWMLVRGFMNSANILIYSFIILFLMLYIFSCLSVEIITKNASDNDDPAYRVHVEKYFSSLPQTMMTLIRFACLDNTSEIYAPLVEREPLLALFFIPIIFTVSMVMFHLLGAVIFSSTLDQNANELDAEKFAKEAEWGQLILDLKFMFERLDEDKSGRLSQDELMNINPADQERLTEALGLSSPLQVFNALDVDKSGEVSITEFFDGVWEVAIQKSDIELKRMEKQIEAMHWRIKETFGVQHDLQVQMMRLFRHIDNLVYSWQKDDPERGDHGVVAGGQGRLGGGVCARQNSLQSSPGRDAASASLPRRTSVVDKALAVGVANPIEDLLWKMRQGWEEYMAVAMEDVSRTIEQAKSDACASMASAERIARQPGASSPSASGRASSRSNGNSRAGGSDGERSKDTSPGLATKASTNDGSRSPKGQSKGKTTRKGSRSPSSAGRAAAEAKSKTPANNSGVSTEPVLRSPGGVSSTTTAGDTDDTRGQLVCLSTEEELSSVQPQISLSQSRVEQL